MKKSDATQRKRPASLDSFPVRTHRRFEVIGVHTGGPAVTQRLLLQRLPGKVEPLAVQLVALTVRVAMPGGKGKPVEQVKLRPG
jgi:hypothetical protein